MRRSTQRRSNEGFMTRLLDPATRIHSRFRALQVELAVLEWNLSRSYVWRAGLHAAGSLMMYEELSPGLSRRAPSTRFR